MNKLQRLYDSGIGFSLTYNPTTRLKLEIGDETLTVGYENGASIRTFQEAIDALWSAAREAYPDAECFKEEK